MQTELPQDDSFIEIAQQFAVSGVRAILLLGSYARGDAGPYSDVDLLRLIDDGVGEPEGSGSHLIDGRLVNVSNADPAQVEAWFTKPNQAVNVVASLRDARALIDPDNRFTELLERANSFTWTDEMQAKANAYASQEMVGWIEEVHKGLEGLRRLEWALEDAELAQEVTGRLLHARFGCTFGLCHVVQVQRGIAINSDNAFYADVAEAVGRDSTWSRLRSIAFGVGHGGRVPTLREQVEAGLLLYAETAKLLDDAILPEHRPLIQHTVDQISEYW